MSTKDKIIDRLKSHPKDFTWDELVKVFKMVGFTVENKGKTSGSRVLFRNGDKIYFTHKPHPSNIVKESSLKQALNYLIDNDFIK